MELLGVDFGTSRLRIASLRNGSVGIETHRFSSSRLPFVLESATPFRITALKRMLDFENAFPVPPSGVSSTSLLAQIFREALADCCPEGWDQRNAIVTVPPCFSQRQRSALRSVMTDSGLARARLVDDTLAALCASWERVRTYSRILVYSWGAGTFSAAMYWMKSNAYQLISQEGDRQLGGDDFDAVLAETIVAELNKLGRDAAPKNDEDFIRIVSVAESVKRSLGSQNAVEVSLGRLRKMSDSEYIRVPTASFTNALKRSTEQTINLALKAAKMASGEKPEAILALGGTAQSPFVQDALQRALNIPVIDAAEDSVAIGAVLFGQRLPQSEWDGAERQVPNGRGTAGSTRARSDIASGAQANPQIGTRIAQEKWAQNFVPLLDAAQAEYDAGKLASAIAAFEHAMDALGRFKGDLYRKAAAALHAEGRTTQALDLLREGNQRDSRNRFIAVDFAETCYREAVQARSIHKPQITVELASQGASSLRHLPARESNNAGLLAALLHLQGIGFVDQGKLAQAVPVIAESVTLDPRNGAYTKDLEKVRKMLKELGPNDRCPCQSGLKYKKCCGRTR